MSEYLCIKHACLEPAMENDILCRKHGIESPIVPVNCGSCEYREMLEGKVAELEARITGIKTITVWNLDSAYKDVKRPNATTMIVLLTDLKKLVEGD